MKRLLYILLFLPLFANGQMIINSYQFASGGGGGGSFPTTNQLFAFEADFGVTHSSNVVSAWDDKSVNNRDALQSSSSNRPDWNGTDAISFVIANSDYLTISYAPTLPLNIYMVVRMNDLGSQSYLWGELGSFFCAFDGASDKIGVTDGSNTIYMPTAVANTSTYYLIHIHIESGTNASYLAVNNGSNTTGTLSSGPFTSPFYLGTLKFSGGPFGYGSFTLKSIMGYGTQNSTDIANTKAAFNTKYSLY
jgi:hypothetical protein